MQRQFQLRNGPVLERVTAFNSAAKDEDKISITGNQVPPVGLYGYFQRDKCIIQFSGFGSRDQFGKAINGQVGQHGATLEEGQQAAKGACLNFLNNLASVCDGDLDGVKTMALRVDINCDPNFKDLPKVANGASQLLINVFGKFTGTPIRTAAGSSSLPNNMMVEITGTVYITKELSVKLDLLAAKKLSAIACWSNEIMSCGIDFNPISQAINSSSKLTKPMMAILQIGIDSLCRKIIQQDYQFDHQAWEIFSKEQNLLDKPESKKELIELILHKAKNLNLTFIEEKLSKYSSLFGSINHEHTSIEPEVALLEDSHDLTSKKKIS